VRGLERADVRFGGAIVTESSPAKNDLLFEDSNPQDSVRDLSEQKDEEYARLYSEEKYRLLVETASDAIVSIDDKGMIVFANPAIATVFGYEPTEVIGKPLTILMPEYMRKLHEGGFKRYLATGQRHINWQGTELAALRKNGEEFPAEISFGELTRDGHKVFTGFLRDVSKRKQAEIALRAAMDERTRISAFREEIGIALSHQEDLKGILHNCAGAVVRHLDAAFARIWTLSGDGRELELQASAGKYTRLDGVHSRIPVGQHKIGLIAQERKPHLTNDVQNDPGVSDKDWARQEKMVAFAGYPLILEDGKWNGGHTSGSGINCQTMPNLNGGESPKISGDPRVASSALSPAEVAGSSPVFPTVHSK